MSTISKKKNICIFIKDLSAGGAEKQAILLAEMLSSYHNVILVLYNKRIDEVYQKVIEDDKYTLKVLSGNILVKSIQLMKLLKKNKIEVIFCYLLLANFIGGIIGIMSKVRYRVGGIRSSLLEPHKEIVDRWTHNFINTHTIFNNYAGYDRYTTKGFRENKSYVIPNFIDVSELEKNVQGDEKLTYRNNSSNKSNSISILSVGRFVAAKDYQTSLDSVRSMIDKGYTNIIYTIVGFGQLENEIRKQIREDNLSSFVNVVINPKDILSYYQNSDIYLITSIFEGLSNTIMEAMCFKLPVVATNVGDNVHLVENQKNGFLTQPKDVDAISEALIKLVESKDLRISYGLRSYEKVNSNYSEKNFRNNYLEFLNRLN